MTRPAPSPRPDAATARLESLVRKEIDRVCSIYWQVGETLHDEPRERLALAIIAAVNACEGWRPIESAPKDGTEVLIAAPSDRGHWIDVSRFFDGAWRDDSDEDRPFEDPTHWRPLPAPPGIAPSAAPVPAAALGKIREALEDAKAFIGVMFGDADGGIPEKVHTPLHIPVMVGFICKDIVSALRELDALAAEGGAK